MTEVYVEVNLKGGVTKTTTTINVALAASLLGKRVLVIDTDLQGNATTGLGHEPSTLKHTVYTLMTGISRFEETVKHTYFDKVSKRFVDPADEELLKKRRIKVENIVAGPDLLPCNITAAKAENELIHNPAWGSLLRNALQRYRSQYDYIFIDTHPDLGKMTVNGFVAADHVIIPTIPEPWPTDGLIILSSSIAEAQQVNPTLQVAGILFTRVRYAEHNRLMDYIRETLVPKMNQSFPSLSLSCFQVNVNESAAFIASTNKRSCVVLSHPIDAVSLSYWAFLAELLQKIESPDFPLAYQQFQQLLRLYKEREQERSDAKAVPARGEE